MYYQTDDEMRADMERKGYQLLESTTGKQSTYEHYYGGADYTGPDRHVVVRIPNIGTGSIAFYRYWGTEP